MGLSLTVWFFWAYIEETEIERNIGKGKINRDIKKIRKENKTKIITTTTKPEQVIAKYN